MISRFTHHQLDKQMSHMLSSLNVVFLNKIYITFYLNNSFIS
jgi:hypothetical protein